MSDRQILEDAITFIEGLTAVPLLTTDDIEMRLQDVQEHARIEAASLRKRAARIASLEATGCMCRDVPIGSHKASVVMELPGHMAATRVARVEAGLSPNIALDACLVEEVRDLWSKGIRTTGCCCGHNRAIGYIGVDARDIPTMKAMGYVVRENSSRPGDEDSFVPKSVRLSASLEAERARTVEPDGEVLAILDDHDGYPRWALVHFPIGAVRKLCGLSEWQYARREARALASEKGGQADG